MMDKLNSDMVLEILNRLPVESVPHCRRVCAIWRNLLGKPKTGMLFINTTKNGYELDYIEQFQEMLVTKIWNVFTGVDTFNLIGSCNGLVCYSMYEPKFSLVIYIFNPITGERIRVPGQYYGRAGFGYCHSTRTYKVVRSFYVQGFFSSKHGVQVYTLGDGNGWKEKPIITYKLTEKGVFANGALHWLIKTESSKWDIVSFDLEDETFQCLPSPHLTSNSSINVTREGDLCLCLPYIEQGEPMMDVWVFKKKNINNCGCSTRLRKRTYINSFTWIKVFRRKLGSGSKCQLLSLTQSEILLLQNGVISCYDVKATAATKLWCAEGAKGYVHATPHMNTLVSLKDLGEDLVDAHPKKLA